LGEKGGEIRRNHTLIVHPNPILGSNCCAITGKTTPPVALPLAISEIAKTRFLTKYVLKFDTVGQKIIPFPKPCARP